MKKQFKLQTFLALILIGIIIWISISIIANASEVNNSAVTTSNKPINMYSFYWLLTIVGGSIGVTLAYVSWKKYKAEKKNKVKKDSNS